MISGLQSSGAELPSRANQSIQDVNSSDVSSDTVCSQGRQTAWRQHSLGLKGGKYDLLDLLLLVGKDLTQLRNNDQPMSSGYEETRKLCHPV